MAEECPASEVPKIKEDDTLMECEASDPQSVKADESASDKGASTLPVSGATSAAVSISDSECAMNVEDTSVKERALTLPVSGATSAAASTSVSSECVKSPEDAHVEEGDLTSPVSVSSPAAISGSECVKSPDDPHAKVTPNPLGLPGQSAPAPVSEGTASHQEIMSAEKVAEMLSPEKEKVGLFKGVKTAIKTKVKSVWKKLSPKKADKSALAASAQEAESAETSAPESDKPVKVVTYVSATRGSLVLNSVASEEITLDTDLPTSASEVFLPDEESIATCDTATHASRLPSLGDSSEESPEHKAQESSDRGEEAIDDGNVAESS